VKQIKLWLCNHAPQAHCQFNDTHSLQLLVQLQAMGASESYSFDLSGRADVRKGEKQQAIKATCA